MINFWKTASSILSYFCTCSSCGRGGILCRTTSATLTGVGAGVSAVDWAVVAQCLKISTGCGMSARTVGSLMGASFRIRTISVEGITKTCQKYSLPILRF